MQRVGPEEQVPKKQTRDREKTALVHWAAGKLRVPKRTLYNLLQKGVITEDELRQKVVPWMGKFVCVGEMAEVCKRSERTVYRWLENEKVFPSCNLSWVGL